MVPGFDPASAQRRREALVAAIVTFPEARQPAVLREYLDAELSRLEAMDDAHHAFLSECVLLAIDNMQDARLQFVEDRLAKLENPDGPSLAETLTEAALVFAVSIATVVAVETAGVGLVLLFAAEAAAPAARRAVEAADDVFVATMRSNVSSLSTLQAERALKAQQLRGVTTVLGAFRGGSVSSNLWQVGKALVNPIATARSVSDVLSKAFTVTADMEEITAKTLLAHLSMVEGIKTSMAARTAYENALRGDAGRFPTRMRNFLDNSTGGIVLQPVQTLMESAAKNLASAGTSSGSKVANPFLASTPAGRLLSLMRESRMAVHEEYACLRASLRYRADDRLLEDPLVAQLFEVVTQLTPLRATYQSLQDSVRPLLVRGYEVALWWAYLETNGMLRPKEGIGYESFDAHHEPGDVVEGYVICSEARAVDQGDGEPRLPLFGYKADFYPGVLRLTEPQAEYLYETFAAPYFSTGRNADILLFDFDPANYAGVRAQQEKFYGGFIANTERARRMEEMRLMVILFFVRLPEVQDPTSSKLLASLGEIRGAQPSVQRWLELNPAGTAPPPPQPLADGSAARAAQAAAPALAAAFADSGVLDSARFEKNRAKLHRAWSVLHNDILETQALDDGRLTPAASTRKLDVEEYTALVKKQQTELLELFTDILTAAQSDEDESRALLTDYEGLIERLTTWTLPPTTSKPDGSRFRFEAPAPTP